MATSRESTVMSKYIIENHKPRYEKLKKECKHQIMINAGEQHAVVLSLKECVISDVDISVVPMSLNFELSIMRLKDVQRKCVRTDIFKTPTVLYAPNFSQCEKWAKSTEARRAFIKEVLKDLKTGDVC